MTLHPTTQVTKITHERKYCDRDQIKNIASSYLDLYLFKNWGFHLLVLISCLNYVHTISVLDLLQTLYLQLLW